MESIVSLWKDLGKSLKKTHCNQRESLPQSSRRVLTDVQNRQLYQGFNFAVVTGQRHEEQLGVMSDVCDMENCHTTSLWSPTLKVLLQRLERMLSDPPTPPSLSVTPALWHH